MSRFSRLQVLNAIVDSGLVPMFYHGKFEVAKSIALACASGGAKVLEFTNRGDRAYEVFSQLVATCEREQPGLILGIGSIVDAPTAAMFLAAGANFIVGPMFNPEIARLCNRRKIAYLPGCGTVTEISAAEEMGVEIVKIFPGSTLGGPPFVKAILGPCPWSRLMPSGGVEFSRENIEAWFQAGVACVGMGSNLIDKPSIDAAEYSAITSKVTAVLKWIEEIRSSRTR